MQKILIQFVILVAVVTGLSFVSHRLWAGKRTKPPADKFQQDKNRNE